VVVRHGFSWWRRLLTVIVVTQSGRYVHYDALTVDDIANKLGCNAVLRGGYEQGDPTRNEIVVNTRHVVEFYEPPDPWIN
jgi:hypothetical protein